MSNIGSPLQINSIVSESVVDGPGIRLVVFVQGCPHQCIGCHNPQTHDFNGGSWITEESILQQIQDNPLLSGVTFSGGEPFCQPGALARIASRIHELGLDVLVYSGFTLEQLCEMARQDKAVAALLAQTDTLVDGPFILAERDLTLPFRGSRNQRLIDRSEIQVVWNRLDPTAIHTCE